MEHFIHNIVEIVVDPSTAIIFTDYHKSTILCSASKIMFYRVKLYRIDNASTIRAKLKWRSNFEWEEIMKNVFSHAFLERENDING